MRLWINPTSTSVQLQTQMMPRIIQANCWKKHSKRSPSHLQLQMTIDDEVNLFWQCPRRNLHRRFGSAGKELEMVDKGILTNIQRISGGEAGSLCNLQSKIWFSGRSSEVPRKSWPSILVFPPVSVNRRFLTERSVNNNNFSNECQL